MTTRACAWEGTFLDELRVHCNVSAAARQAGIDRRTVYARRKRSKAFATKWDEARREGIDTLALKAHTVALKGDGSMIRWLLSRLSPADYGDKVALEHTGAGGAALFPTVEVRWHDAGGASADVGETAS